MFISLIIVVIFVALANGYASIGESQDDATYRNSHPMDDENVFDKDID
jgi:hypothetical protein